MKKLKILSITFGILLTQLGLGAAAADKTRANKALIKAVKNGNIKGVRGALSDGADVDATDVCGWTALYLVSYSKNQQTKVVSLLLDHGANVNTTDKYGCTALHKAVYRGHDAQCCSVKAKDL